MAVKAAASASPSPPPPLCALRSVDSLHMEREVYSRLLYPLLVLFPPPPPPAGPMGSLLKPNEVITPSLNCSKRIVRAVRDRRAPTSSAHHRSQGRAGWQWVVITAPILSRSSSLTSSAVVTCQGVVSNAIASPPSSLSAAPVVHTHTVQVADTHSAGSRYTQCR